MIRPVNIKHWVMQAILTNKRFEETMNDICKIFSDFETITSGEQHMPYLCCIYNDEIQQECVGIDTCAVDMLNALPIG